MDDEKGEPSGSDPCEDDSEENIFEIILDAKQRDLLSAENLGHLLGTCPVFQLESAWGSISSPCKFPATPEDVSKNLWLRQWSPLNFKDDTQKAYYRYQPCLLETGTKLYYVVCLEPGISDYKYIGTHSWIALPPLNFLPPGCDRVIAGSAGLLVLDGGEQPGAMPITLWGRPAVPNDKFWKDGKARKQSGGQSIVCVANPLTREFVLLPPIPKRRVHGKIAKFVFSDLSRKKYHLVIAGWDTMRKKGKIADIMCVVVYSSEKQCFVHANSIEKARPIPYHECGRSGMAVVNFGVYFGGVKILERINDEDIDIPAIYYFNISDSKRQCMCFDFKLDYMAGREVQPPKVLQAGPTQVFAVTRYATIPTIIWIVEVELHPDGMPTGKYKKVPGGVMPSLLYLRLFPSEDEALLPYECTGVDGKITFKVNNEQNVLVTYDSIRCMWGIFEHPKYEDQRNFQLFDGCYEPDFTARP
ncbi:uncharacterized protein [Physcomitrium patens]|uniref:uncharacterized protein n=1 Tax=Physcomitrium patens TaxID=3218 RepID=UPI003CCD4184